MNKSKDYDLEEILFQYMDQIKYLISPELWGNEVLNCSKNELFVLFLLYRNEMVNMTQIADYLGVPLNTATGIVSRMEKKKLLERTRSAEDRRVIRITMTELGKSEIKQVMKQFLHYGTLIFDSFSADEVQLVFRLLEKVMGVLGSEQERQESSKKQGTKIRKITIE